MNADTLDRERLAKLLGMLGSEHDGEIAAAGRAADRLRREAGMTWRQIIAPALLRPDNDDAIADPIDFLLRFPDALNDWEHRFVASLARQRRPLSKKQRAVLCELVERCRTAARAAA